jgi:ABC-type multidrug transport system fused ATPase/permease subunit
VGRLGSSLPYVKDLREFMEKGKVSDPENPVELPDTTQPPIIEFRNVSFSYTDESKILDELDFTVNAGEKIALVGINGAGKTTAMKLLCGFLSPDEGEVTIYGKDTRHYRREDIYSLFSAVFQDELILPLTLAENITSNFEDAEGIRAALERAELWEYVGDLPKGIDTYMTKAVSEDGLILSGGQNQKLFLARALYKDAPVLLLDEPTASLDPLAESAVYEQYHELTVGKTSIFISHRLASTRFCDRILLLADGKVAESGSHDELMALGGEYAKMYEIQSHYYKDQESKTADNCVISLKGDSIHE